MIRCTERRAAKIKAKRLERDEMKQRILEMLPTTQDTAITKIKITVALQIPGATVTSIIKELRQSRVPIIWLWRNGVYIDYDSDALHKMNQKIENSKRGFVRWMTNIQDMFADIIANWK